MNRLPGILYAPLLGVAMLVMMLRPLLMVKVFNTSEFGLYSYGLLISSTFCILNCLGFYLLLQRSMPMNIVKGKERAPAILIVQCNMLALFSALSVILLVGDRLPGLERSTIVASLLHGFAQQAFLVATVESRSRGESMRFAAQNMVRAVLLTVAALIITARFESATLTLFAEAFFAFGVAAYITSNAIKKSNCNPRLLFVLALSGIASLPWRTATSLLGVGLIGFAIINADRWLAATLFSPEQFGLYAFAWITLGVAQSLQAIVSSSLFPAISRDYALHGMRSAFKMSSVWGGGLILTGIVFYWPVTALISWGINNWFSNYNEVISIIPIFIFLAIIRVSDFWTGFLIVASQESALLRINAWSAIFAVMLVVGFYYAGLWSEPGMLLLASFTLIISLVRQVAIVIYSARLSCF